MSRPAQLGFATIEWVVVLVVLGILAAFAVPRFMGVDAETRVVAVNGMAGSIRSAANMAHGLWMANGNVSPITVDGQPITIVDGYPDAAGIRALIQDSTGFTVIVDHQTTTFTPVGARMPGSCYVRYGQAEAGAGAAPFSIGYPGGETGRQATLHDNC